MDMKASEERASDVLSAGDVGGVFYTVLYAVISFLLVLVALLLFYVACSRKYRLNWFERNLLETAETSELTSSHDALISVTADGERRSSRRFSRESLDDKLWIPVGKATRGTALDPLDTSGDESETVGSPSTSRGSKTSLAVDSLLNEEGTTTAQPIARNDKHVVLTTMAAKPMISMNAKLDFTKIDTTLYEKPEDSAADDLMVDDRGRLHLSLAYDTAAGMLSVRLIEAESLLSKDISDSADPYAKIRLLPDRSNVWQTRIHKKTLNPVFDEDFVFEVRAMTLSRRTLEIILYDFDAYARHQSMGGIKLSLSDIDLTEKQDVWKSLGPCSEQDEKAELGDLLISLSYLPSAERLTVVVMKARNLRIVDENRLTSDPYVKVTLTQGGKRLKKKKSSIHRNTQNPTFNERFTFDVNKETLSKCCLEFCVYHDAKSGPCELLGRAVVGPTSSCRPEHRAFFAESLSSKAANAKWLMLEDPR